MDTRFHLAITGQALSPFFDKDAMDEIVKANMAQDSVLNLLRNRPHVHFDDSLLAEGWAYVEEQHAEIVRLVGDPNGGREQRIALGRLCHAVQDFYAHTNYVDLWLEAHGGVDNAVPGEIDAQAQDILDHPWLCSGHLVPWRDWVYYLPLLKRLARRVGAPAGSHEAMNLDAPDRGPRFDYALAAATQRTRHVYRRAVRAVGATGGPEALDRFHNSRFVQN